MSEKPPLSSIEEFRPRLRQGQIIPQGNRIIYETLEPYDQIILPVELADVLLLCSGKLTVRDIISKVYKHQGIVHFKATFKLILSLQERGFLENGHLLKSHNFPLSEVRVNQSPFPLSWKFSIGRRVINNNGNPLAFYLIAMVFLASALWSLMLVDVDLSFIETMRIVSYGFVNTISKLLIANSLILTASNVIKAALLLILTGRLYNLSLRLSPFGIWLESGEETLHLIDERLYKFLFHMTAWLSPLSVMSLVYAMDADPIWRSAASLVAIFWMALNLNPLANTPVQRLLKLMEDRNDPMRMSVFPTGPTIPTWNLAPLLLISVWIGVIGMLGNKIHSHLSWPPAEVKPMEWGAGVLMWIFIWVGLGSLLLQSLRHSWRQFIFPSVVRLYRRLTSRVHFAPSDWTQEAILDKIQDLPLLGYFPESLLQDILKAAEVRNYPAKTQIVREGEAAEDLFILIQGEVEVFKRISGHNQRLTSIYPTTIFGESAIVENSTRSADVFTKGGATVVRLSAQSIRKAAEHAQCGREFEAFKNAMMVNQFFSSAPYFRDLPQEAIDVLTMKARLLFKKPGDVIFRQGDAGESFYLIVRGSVDVMIHDRVVNRLSQGGFFGEVSLIADIPRTATICAHEDSVMLNLSRDAFWEVLVQNLNLAMIIESISEQRLLEDLPFHEEASKRTG